jgi:hypothetical protein
MRHCGSCGATKMYIACNPGKLRAPGVYFMKYKIVIECLSGFDNFERTDPDKDDSPAVTYDSVAEAETELQDFIECSRFANSKGYLETPYARDEFKIVVAD